MVERRRAPRAHIRLPLRMQVPGAFSWTECVAVDFSNSGMFIATTDVQSVGTQLIVESITADRKTLLRARVEVVRSQPEGLVAGIGVTFLELSDEAQTLLNRLVSDEQKFGNFRLDTVIGKGGMAEVYRAEVLQGQHAGRIVALKRLLPELASETRFIDLFIAEADISRVLDHDNILKVVETGSVEDSYYIALEYVEGGTLNELMCLCKDLNKPMPIDLAVQVIKTIAKALDYAHNLCGPNGTPYGIVHRDVTPSNIFISYQGEIKLGDFGVAHIEALAAAEETIWAGKDPYLAPEQIRRQEISPAADVFAMGAVLYEMLTNQLAFDGDSTSEIHKKILAGQVEPVSRFRPDVPKKIEKLILRAVAPYHSSSSSSGWKSLLSSKAATRFPTAKAFLEAIEPLSEPLANDPDVLAGYIRRLVKPK